MVQEVSREDKIKDCYQMAKILGYESECPYEDMIDENLHDVYINLLYYSQRKSFSDERSRGYEIFRRAMSRDE